MTVVLRRSNVVPNLLVMIVPRRWKLKDGGACLLYRPIMSLAMRTGSNDRHTTVAGAKK